MSKLWNSTWQEIVPSNLITYISFNTLCLLHLFLLFSSLSLFPSSSLYYNLHFILVGTSTAVRLYIKEILEIVCPSLSSQSWDVKKQAAKAIATIAENTSQFLILPYSRLL